MSMTDPIADFLTRVRNGITAAHEEVEIPSSKLKREMARILKEQGYIRDFEIEAANPDHPGELIRVTLKYTDERREREAPAALDDLRDAVDLDDPLLQVEPRWAHRTVDAVHTFKPPSRTPLANAFTLPWYW